jgi:branched-chain amino acid aminotransferase
MAIVTAATPAVHHEAINPRVKSLNYLNNILAKIEALNAGVEEAIMLNGQGYVAECTGDNIFMVDGGRVLTPSVTSGLLVGCTRNAVLRLAREAGHEVIETELQRFDLYNADECFLTGTAAEIVPVVKIDGRVVGTGEPGPVTTDLLTRFRRFIESY